MAGFWNSIIKFFTGGAATNLVEKVEETIEEMEIKVERATKKAIKASALYLMIFIGALFMLIGLAQYLNEAIPNMAHGLGTVVVGAVLVILAMFARFFRN